ncbi:MAG TPA: ImmA/IrrE family metallo-endopeptidase [Candidatus Acidoferrum sp.]|nr:ImmA/IrrE family metallo-endopeptidase [Candidatus Acidoferrum sp.]
MVDRQAIRLLKLSETLGPPVPINEIASALPRIIVKHVPDLPSSGRAQWNGSGWVLLVDSTEAKVRQRYSLSHELAHVIWHPLTAHALPDTTYTLAEDRIEQACEYFAACLLMPRVWMKRAYFDQGIQDVPSLARLFGVSWLAMRYRLEHSGSLPDLPRRPHEDRRRVSEGVHDKPGQDRPRR